MPRLTREESRARTRGLLVEAAGSEISRKGYANASVRDIAAAAGFSQGAFYSNFQGKDDILLEVVRRHQTEERGRVQRVLDDASGDPAAALAGLQRWAATLNPDDGSVALTIELQLQALRNPVFAEGYQALNKVHMSELGHLIVRLLGLFGKQMPGDPVEIATGFIALGRGMALMARDMAPGSTGRVAMMFLRAMISAAQAGAA